MCVCVCVQQRIVCGRWRERKGRKERKHIKGREGGREERRKEEGTKEGRMERGKEVSRGRKAQEKYKNLVKHTSMVDTRHASYSLKASKHACMYSLDRPVPKHGTVVLQGYWH